MGSFRGIYGEAKLEFWHLDPDNFPWPKGLVELTHM